MTCRHRAWEAFHNHNGTDKKTDKQTKLGLIGPHLTICYLFKNFSNSFTFSIRDTSQTLTFCTFM